MRTLGHDSSEVCLWLEQEQEQDDTWRQYFFTDNEIWATKAGEIFSSPAEDPPALASPPTSLPSLDTPSRLISKLASPPCLEFDPTGVAASEGSIEVADARSSRPASDLKDCDYGGECGPKLRKQLLEVASRAANTGDLRLDSQFVQWFLNEVEAIPKPGPEILAGLGGGIVGYNPASRASYCDPELGELYEGLLIFSNALRSQPSRGNSTGAKYTACAKGPKRGHRSPNWTSEEKDAFLEVKVEAQTVVKGKDWDFISEALKDRFAFERSAKSCEDLWGTLVKSFKVIQHHEAMNHSSNWCSYWELDENGRSKRQLPKSFSFKWYEMIESIRARKTKRAAGDQQWTTTKDPGLTSLGAGAGEYSSLLRLADGLLNQQTQEDLAALAQAGGTSTSNTLKQGLGPYLHTVVIDALQSALKPLATILQCEHEEKQEFDAKMKALDKKRRALDLEEMQIKRQRGGQYQRISRSTCRPKQQAELSTKMASVKEIIPAFKELNIATSGPGAHRFA